MYTIYQMRWIYAYHAADTLRYSELSGKEPYQLKRIHSFCYILLVEPVYGTPFLAVLRVSCNSETVSFKSPS
jgi:hypothetical protein